MSVSESDVLLLRPKFAIEVDTIRRIIESLPGAFRHPTEGDVWLLPSIAAMSDEVKASIERNPAGPTFTTSVYDKSPASIEIGPGGTGLAAGRARKLVSALLELGPFDLEVHGEHLGEVKNVAEIYGDAQWCNPGVSTDPTESPRLTGTLIVFDRHGDQLRELLAFHDSGVVSYEQRQPLEDEGKTYRRIDLEHHARIRDILAALPLVEEPGAGPSGEYVEPAFFRVETPTDILAEAKLEIARPGPACGAFIAMVEPWMAALRVDRASSVQGLLELPR